MRNSNEQALLERLQAGDDRAIAELSEMYGVKIYQLAFRYLRNKEDAEEITQDVLMKVHRNVGEFRGDAALSSWIYRITFNAAMSRLRSTRSERAQNDDRHNAEGTFDSTTATARLEPADWSEMADEHVF